MDGVDGDNIDLEPTNQYLRKVESGVLGLEPVDAYVKRVKARINLSNAQAANVAAYMLVGGVVLSLPLYVLAVVLVTRESSGEIATVFTKWYDVVAPLAGAVIGALFGMRVASRERDNMT